MSSKTSGSTESFPLFIEFPKEIRLLIWEATLEPRVVDIRRAQLNKTYGQWQREEEKRNLAEANSHPLTEAQREGLSRARYMRIAGLKSDCPPPKALFVCRESFEVASKFYQRAFGSRFSTGFYTDFTHDIIYLSWHKFGLNPGSFCSLITDINMMGHQSLDDVKNLALLVDREAVLEINNQNRNSQNEDEDGNPRILEDHIASLLGFLSNIKRLTIVAKDYTCSCTQSRRTSAMKFSNLTSTSYSLGSDHTECQTFGTDTSPNEFARGPGLVELNLAKLEKSRVKWIEENPDYTWTLPTIDYKVIVLAGE